MHFMYIIIIILYFQDKSVLQWTEYIWHLLVITVGFGRKKMFSCKMK